MKRTPESYVFDGTSEGIRQVVDLYGRETKVLCPVCNGQLSFAISPEEIEVNDGRGGFYCPMDRSHVDVVLKVSDESETSSFWKRVDERTRLRLAGREQEG